MNGLFIGGKINMISKKLHIQESIKKAKNRIKTIESQIKELKRDRNGSPSIHVKKIIDMEIKHREMMIHELVRDIKGMNSLL
jgi:hypothetical protein